MMASESLNGGKDILYRWHILHRPELAQFCLYMFRYETIDGHLPVKKWALNSGGHWDPIAEGAEAPIAMSMPDILVHHLAETGVVNFFEGKKVEDTLISFCARIMLAVGRDPKDDNDV